MDERDLLATDRSPEPSSEQPEGPLTGSLKSTLTGLDASRAERNAPTEGTPGPIPSPDASESGPTSWPVAPLPAVPPDMVEPAWWWAPAHTLPYKPRPVKASEGDPSSTLLSEAFVQRVARDVQGWLDRPLVWRDDGTTVQAVLLGVLRYTWSRRDPAGRLEVFHLEDGWRTVAAHQTVTLGYASHGVSLHDILPQTLFDRGRDQPLPVIGLRWALVTHMVEAVFQHNARSAQQVSGARRATLWVAMDEPARRSWAPVFFDVPGQGRATTPTWYAHAHALLPEGLAAHWLAESHLPVSLVQPVWDRARVAATRLARVLNAHSPLWGALRRLSCWPNTPIRQGLVWIQRCFQDMHAWEQRLREQPNAVLMLPFVEDLGLLPNANLWREDAWVPRLLPTPLAWRFALRHGPMASVRAMLHRGGFNGGWFDLVSQQLPALGAMSTLPEAAHAVPSAAWRLVPPDVWTHVAQGDQGLVMDDEVEENNPGDEDPLARNRWHRDALRAYLRAVQARPWVDQQISMTAWLTACKPVWEWVVLNPVCPFDDPSWTWLSLMDLATVRALAYPPAWESLLHAGRIGPATITPVNSLEQWKALGILMQNCLKDSRSEHYRMAVRNRWAFLYRLDLNGRSSVAVIGLSHAGTEAEGWSVLEQRSTANTHATADHVRLARGLAALHHLQLRRRPWRERLVERWRSWTGPSLDQQALPHELAAWFSAEHLKDLRNLVNPTWAKASAHHARKAVGRQCLDPRTWLNGLWDVWTREMINVPPHRRWTNVLIQGVILGAIAMVLNMLVQLGLSL